MTHQTQKDITFKEVFEASKAPGSLIAVQCGASLSSISISKIDYFLRSLLGSLKHDPRVLSQTCYARCLGYIFNHGIKLRLEEGIRLASFKACFRWAVDIFVKTTHDTQNPEHVDISHLILYCVKFTCSVMENLEKQSTNAQITSSIISDFKYRQGVKGLLSWSQSNLPNVRSYAIRALAAQKSRLGKEIAASDGYIILSNMLVDIPRHLKFLSRVPSMIDSGAQHSELLELSIICNLIDQALNVGKSSELARFTDSASFQRLFSVWCSICQFHYSRSNEDPRANPGYAFKFQPRLVYVLTSIVQKCAAASDKAANLAAEDKSRERWRPLFILLMRRWIIFRCYICVEKPTEDLACEEDILVKLFKITANLAKVTPTYTKGRWPGMHPTSESSTDLLLYDLTNFLMLYVSQPIWLANVKPLGSREVMQEQQFKQKIMSKCQLDADKLDQDKRILAVCFHAYNQHFRCASTDILNHVAARMSHCLKIIALVLSDANQLETSTLRSGLSALIQLFMIRSVAIDIFADSTTKISAFLWEPFIQRARKGLESLGKLSPDSELTFADNSIMNKTKIVLITLANITTRRGGSQALLENNVHQLVDESFILSRKVMQKHSQLLAVYTAFGRFILALADSALLRRRLWDETGLLPFIINMLHDALILKENRRTLIQDEADKEQKIVRKDPIFKDCIDLMSSCLCIVGRFQYSGTHMEEWISYEYVKKVDEPKQIDEDTVMSEQGSCLSNDDKDTSEIEKLSILPSVLSSLLPWRNNDTNAELPFDHVMHYISTDLQVMLMASQLLEMFSGLVPCRRQLLADGTVLSNLGLLMVCLRAVEYGFGEKYYASGPCYPTVAASKKEHRKIYLIEQLPETTYKIFDETLNEYVDQCWWSDDSECSADSWDEPFENTPTVRCADKIKKSVIKLLTTDKQFTVMSDPFTSFFRYIMQHLITGTSQEYWLREVCQALCNLGLKGYLELHKFSKGAENAIKLHEMSAVAVGYATIGASSGREWNESLGLTVLNECMVNTPEVFGTLCQMLVYELEYEERIETGQGESLLAVITPLRRLAAAQTIEALALRFERKWRKECKESMGSNTMVEQVTLTNSFQLVHFVTDDAEPNTFISGKHQLLVAYSPIFEALLGGNYAESKLPIVPIHDVTFHSLELFIRTIHQLNEKAEATIHVTQDDKQEDKCLGPAVSWSEIVELLQMSDQFASSAVKEFCEKWVLGQTRSIHQNAKRRVVHLNGLIRLYRHCRDPIEIDGGITSNTWPFATVLYEALKTITQYMTESSKTKEFAQMVKDKNVEELDAFCNGVAYLLQRHD